MQPFDTEYSLNIHSTYAYVYVYVRVYVHIGADCKSNVDSQ